MKRIIFTIALFTAVKTFAQVGIGTTTPNTSAILDLTSTTKGLLIPRMTAGEVTVLTAPAHGLLVYQTDGTAGFYYNSGTPASPVWNYILTNKAAIPTASVSGDVELAPVTAQRHITDGSHLINLRMLGSTVLGNAGSDRLISISDSAKFIDGNTYDDIRFTVEADGSILSNAVYNSGYGGCPQEGAGNRFMWYAGKSSLRAGGIDGTQWDDANIGLYSTAFGENARALGDNAIAIGKSCIAAGSRTTAIGEGCTATGYASMALGYGASTSTSAGSPRLGTFVFSDFSVPLVYSFGSNIDANSQFHPTVTNSFNVRAVNGTFMYTNTALTTGLVFNSSSATLPSPTASWPCPAVEA